MNLRFKNLAPVLADTQSSARFPSSSGFTIVELLIGLMICTLMFALGFRLFQRSRYSQEKLGKKLTLQSDARRAADILVEKVRSASEVVRPSLGESLPFLVVKDERNEMAMYYLEADQDYSKRFDRTLFQLVSYTSKFGSPYQIDREKILIKALKGLQFTCISPGSVLVDATVVNDREEFQFLSHVALMNMGDLE